MRRFLDWLQTDTAICLGYTIAFGLFWYAVITWGN